jgi:hypothetical protein
MGESTEITLGEVYRGLGRVDQSVRELSVSITASHTEVLSKLGEKADKTDIARLETRLDAHESQLATLHGAEQARKERARVYDATRAHAVGRWKVAGYVIGLAASWAIVVVTLIVR